MEIYPSCKIENKDKNKFYVSCWGKLTEGINIVSQAGKKFSGFKIFLIILFSSIEIFLIVFGNLFALIDILDTKLEKLDRLKLSEDQTEQLEGVVNYKG